MIITKFDHTNSPAFVKIQEYTEGVLGYWASVNFNDIKLSDGDYLIQDDNGNLTTYISASQYATDAVSSNLVREIVGKELVRNIWSALRSANMTDANKASIATTITTVIVLIQSGEITSSRALAASLGTTAAFTAGVKASLLSIMDTSILKL